MKYPINEIFYSIQGEGPSIGKPAIFVRLSGCNLRCWFCDTKYTSHHPEFDMIETEEIIERIKKFTSESGCTYVVFTGGEPALFDLKPITDQLNDYFIGLETNGTHKIRGAFDEIVCSPKLSNSAPDDDFKEIHEKNRKLVFDIMPAYPEAHYKFVISENTEEDEIYRYVVALRIRKDRIWLMPEGVYHGKIRKGLRRAAKLCRKNNWNLSDRLHIAIWGNKKGI